jgi:hypothetical protein
MFDISHWNRIGYNSHSYIQNLEPLLYDGFLN